MVLFNLRRQKIKYISRLGKMHDYEINSELKFVLANFHAICMLSN